MIGNRNLVIGSVLALMLVAAPISSAFAGGRNHGGYGHGGGNGGYGYGYGYNPVVGLATALVGVAAAIITAPITILAAVANAPYYGPGTDYSAGPAAYGGPPVAPGYYGAPVAPVYYAPPASPVYYGPPAVTYYSPPVVTYYGPPPVRGYYGTAGRGYYGAQGRGHEAPSAAPRHAQRPPVNYPQAAPVNQGPPPVRPNYGQPPGSGARGAQLATYAPRTTDRGPPGIGYNYHNGNPSYGSGTPSGRYNQPR